MTTHIRYIRQQAHAAEPAAEDGHETCSRWLPQECQDICETAGVEQVQAAAAHAGNHITTYCNAFIYTKLSKKTILCIK